jgi:hypothetical protein
MVLLRVQAIQDVLRAGSRSGVTGSFMICGVVDRARGLGEWAVFTAEGAVTYARTNTRMYARRRPKHTHARRRPSAGSMCLHT